MRRPPICAATRDPDPVFLTLTLRPLPPYSPKHNGIERLWRYMKDRYLSNRVFAGLDTVADACCEAWDAVVAETGRIRTLCAEPWAQVSA
jgi:transposase